MNRRIDDTDRRILEATQGGLPLSVAPFADLAAQIGIGEAEVIRRLDRMRRDGVVRRVGLAPNHYALGLVANGMSVWDVEDGAADELGEKVGALEFVSHCYLRPRALPAWRYNLYAMIHGRDRAAVEELRTEIADALGRSCRHGDILYSTRILKKAGMRLAKGA